MPLFRIADKLVLFVHVPKTGGTTIESVFSRHGKVGLFQESDFRPIFGRCTPQHFHAEIYGALFRSTFFDYAFCVVRHPYARALSEYRMYRGEGLISEDFPPWVRESLAKAKKLPYALDNHLRPQHEFILPDVEVFRFETGLRKILQQVSERLGFTLDGVLPHERRGMNAPVPVTRGAMEILREFYREDFARFGYSDDIEVFLRANPSVALVEPVRRSLAAAWWRNAFPR